MYKTTARDSDAGALPSLEPKRSNSSTPPPPPPPPPPPGGGGGGVDDDEFPMVQIIIDEDTAMEVKPPGRWGRDQCTSVGGWSVCAVRAAGRIKVRQVSTYE